MKSANRLRALAFGFAICSIQISSGWGGASFGDWEVGSEVGSESTKIAQQLLAASDLHGIEYLPKFSVLCERGSISPYGSGRLADFKALKVRITWFASHLPKDFQSLETFLRIGIHPRSADTDGNSVWVKYGRAWDSSNGFSDLITIGDDNRSPIETVKITGTPKGFRLSAEVLDSGAAEVFLKYWNLKGRIPVVLQDSQGHDLNKLVELKGVKPAADQVLSYCSRDPL
jgi:hypothetical protein